MPTRAADETNRSGTESAALVDAFLADIGDIDAFVEAFLADIGDIDAFVEAVLADIGDIDAFVEAVLADIGDIDEIAGAFALLHCRACGEPMDAQRSTRRTCSTRCRKRLSRIRRSGRCL